MTSETSKNFINSLVSAALNNLKLAGELGNLDITAPSNPEFGDYSSNAALILAKKTRQNPKELAAKIIGQINKSDSEGRLESVEEKGGFINFRLSQKFLLENLNKIIEERDLFGCSITGGGKKILMEYFQPNVAKPLHLGHLRTAIIGDSLFRILSSQGYKVESDTHLGDWGTQFGLLLLAYKKYLKGD